MGDKSIRRRYWGLTAFGTLGCGVLLGLAPSAFGQEGQNPATPLHEPNLPGSRAEVYKTVGDVELKIYIYEPEGHRPTDRRPAIVFFFGGGFRTGSPEQFARHCQYLAFRGMVAMTADYRVFDRHRTTVMEAIYDGVSAMRWLRANASRLGVNPNRIVASGGSAGADIAAAVGVVPDLEDGDEHPSVSYTPNAMVLFNPALMGSQPWWTPDDPVAARLEGFRRPYDHVREGLPPAIMLFGTEDYWLADAREFRDAALRAGNRCELLTWDGVGHGFHNYDRNEGREYEETLRAVDRFLVSLGYLQEELTRRSGWPRD